jgi:uncharacterized sulfatase
VRLPEPMRLFPALLRRAGYYTTNNVKEDYNLLKTDDVWDASSATAHWKNRRPGQPFFAVFNTTASHESAIHRKEAPKRHDPAKVRVPAYHPDTPEVRADWASYYDNLSVVDEFVAARLAELEAAGLADDTIVVYFGDHGAGMPRSKRWLYDSGLRVPLLVHVPARFRALAPDGYREGATSDRLVGFVDLAPSMLSLAGVRPPDWMQGRAFLGRHAVAGPPYLYGLRGRMDERYDLLRSVRDARYVYIRNYMPHRIYGQHLQYLFLMPTTRVWKQWYDEGRLLPQQRAFWEPKPVEELYDLETDPDEVRNLADDPAHRAVRDRLRSALEREARRVRDVGFLPEYLLHRGPTPYEQARGAGGADLDAVRRMAAGASDVRVPLAAVRVGLSDRREAVRYWAATGIVVRGPEAVAATGAELLRLLADTAPGPRIVAAEALARFGAADVRRRAVEVLLADANAAEREEYVSLLALNALVQVPDLTSEARAAVERLPRAPARTDQRENYVTRLIDATLKGLR